MLRPRLAASCALAAVALATACSPYLLGDPPENPDLVAQPFVSYLDGMASVCVIRTTRIALGVTFVVHDNEVLVGATRGTTWFCWRAEPGRHRITMRSEDGEQFFDVDLDERGRYFFDQDLQFRLGKVLPHASWVDESQARALLGRSQHRLIQGAPATETILVGTDVVGALEVKAAAPATADAPAAGSPKSPQ